MVARIWKNKDCGRYKSIVMLPSCVHILFLEIHILNLLMSETKGRYYREEMAILC